MVTANDVAKFFTTIVDKTSNMKANKLTYYAQAWALIRLGRPLFNEEIEAWKHGPIIPSVYRAYKQYGDEAIPAPEDTEFLNKFSDEESQLLLDVAREYGCLSTWKLRTDSHGKDEPWQEVYDPAVKHTVISKELIQKYFESKERIPEITIEELVASLPLVDELPNEWDTDDWELLDAKKG